MFGLCLENEFGIEAKKKRKKCQHTLGPFVNQTVTGVDDTDILFAQSEV